MIRDERLPAAGALLGPDAASILAPAVEPRGGIVRSVRPRLVNYWPGASIRLSYDAVVEYADHARRETFGAAANADGTEVWCVPDDPRLPGLGPALDPVFVRELLDGLGIACGAIHLELRSYSPRSRAVVEVSTPSNGALVFRPGRGVMKAPPRPLLFLKATRPERAEKLLRTHDALRGRLPIAEGLVARADIGLVGFAPMAGGSLWDGLQAGAQVPDAAELLSVLERIEDVDLGPAGRPPLRRSVRINAEMLKAVVPDCRDEVDRFLDALGDGERQELVTTHGDFHEMQVLTDGPRVTGLLDLDDAGTGERLDDLAMLVGRLWCFARSEPDGGERIAAYAQTLFSTFAGQFGPEETRRRVAAVALNHATGHFRFQARGWPKLTRAAIAQAGELLSSPAAAGRAALP